MGPHGRQNKQIKRSIFSLCRRHVHLHSQVHTLQEQVGDFQTQETIRNIEDRRKQSSRMSNIMNLDTSNLQEDQSLNPDGSISKDSLTDEQRDKVRFQDRFKRYSQVRRQSSASDISDSEPHNRRMSRRHTKGNLMPDNSDVVKGMLVEKNKEINEVKEKLSAAMENINDKESKINMLSHDLNQALFNLKKKEEMLIEALEPAALVLETESEMSAADKRSGGGGGGAGGGGGGGGGGEEVEEEGGEGKR